MLKKILSKVKRYLFFLAIAIVIIGGWFYLSQRNAATNNKQGEQKYVVKPQNITSELSLSGTVDAEEKAVLQFQTSGQLAWVGVKEGDSVQKWQALANLDQRELKQNLQKKLYDFMDKRWDHDQLKDDYEAQKTDEWNLYLTDEITRIAQQSQFGLNKTIIDVELSQLAIDLSTLITPIDGVVTSIDQPLSGVNITPATARFEVVNPESLFLKAVVDQQDVVKLKTGQKAKLVFDAYPNKTYWGEVYYLSFKPATGEDSSYLVKFTIPKSLLSKLRLGMAAEVNLVTARKSQVLAVPFLAINQEGTKTYVNVFDQNNKTSKRYVTPGIEDDQYVEIIQGLNEEEVVIY